ncbi:MAG: sensor histidine kinase N-terminal domain-containing protein [Hylemonella sp.]|nr:sensor histidine kinase N-terminal domain-containing protein [Hylemonella sp.]MDP1937680.1 sensor histidine kinase N-terminal domain-containing protein [Hylemonella sp.]
MSRKPSLRARLVRHVLLPLGLTWLLGTGVTVGVAYYFAQKAFDRALLDDAHALASQVRVAPAGLSLELSTDEMSAVLFDQSELVFFAVLRPDGSVLAGHPGLHAPSPQGQARSRFSEIYYQGQTLRSVVLRRREPAPFEVVVAQTMGSRNALLHNVLLYSVVPQVLLLLLLAVWLRRIIGQELQPLTELQRSVDLRDALDLTPVPVSASSRDIEHLGTAINALLARVSHSMRAQREFSGNVAHELRTPLAGIRALTEYGLAQQDPVLWREQLQRIGASEARASRLVEQLLALALAEEADAGVQTEPVALNDVVHETVLRYMPRADVAGVDLGVQGLEQPFKVAGNVALIEGILGNLIDNALRYGRAPQGQASAVTVVLAQREGEVQLSVIDNGPGLTPQERSHLVQRGVRGMQAERLGQGAGLGLAIVAKFAAVLQARFELSDAPGGPGLCATVSFRVLASG